MHRRKCFEIKKFILQELLHFNGTFSLHNLLSGSDEVRAREMAKGVFHSKRNITVEEIKCFESVMWNRKQFIKYRCENHPKSKLGNGHWIHRVLLFSKIFSEDEFTEEYDAEVYVPYENVLYSPIYKSASTVWYQNFMILWTVRNVRQ